MRHSPVFLPTCTSYSVSIAHSHLHFYTLLFIFYAREQLWLMSKQICVAPKPQNESEALRWRWTVLGNVCWLVVNIVDSHLDHPVFDEPLYESWLVKEATSGDTLYRCLYRSAWVGDCATLEEEEDSTEAPKPIAWELIPFITLWAGEGC